MKDDSLPSSDVKTPPPLTPKDSLSVEVEEIRNRAEPISAHGYRGGRYLDTKRLLAIVEDLQAQLRRKNEALEKIYDLEKYLKHPRDCLAWATDGDACDCGKDAIMCLTRDALAALFDGKEGGR